MDGKMELMEQAEEQRGREESRAMKRRGNLTNSATPIDRSTSMHRQTPTRLVDVDAGMPRQRRDVNPFLHHAALAACRERGHGSQLRSAVQAHVSTGRAIAIAIAIVIQNWFVKGPLAGKNNKKTMALIMGHVVSLWMWSPCDPHSPHLTAS